MKIRSVRIALALGLLCAIGVFFACTSSPENTNHSGNQMPPAPATSPSSGEHELANGPPECDMSDWENKRQNIEKRISTKNFPKMKYLVQVVKVTSPNERRYVRVLLEGVVYAGHDMQGLIASLKSVLRGKCLEKIYFVPAGTIPQGVKASDEVVDPPEPPGLRWGGCAENMELCKNGECAPMGQCDLKNTNVRTTPTPGVGQNSNSSSGNTGTKANTSSSP